MGWGWPIIGRYSVHTVSTGFKPLHKPSFTNHIFLYFCRFVNKNRLFDEIY